MAAFDPCPGCHPDDPSARERGRCRKHRAGTVLDALHDAVAVASRLVPHTTDTCPTPLAPERRAPTCPACRLLAQAETHLTGAAA